MGLRFFRIRSGGACPALLDKLAAYTRDAHGRSPTCTRHGLGRKFAVLARRAQDALAEANDVAEESLANMQTVRTFGTESYESHRYADHTAHAFDLAKEKSRERAQVLWVVHHL